MQPPSGRNTGIGWSSKKKANPRLKPVVDPRPGNKAPKIKPVVDARPKINVDDTIYRTMPITEKQLGSIKKMYGIK
jgi:hypothetical protein